MTVKNILVTGGAGFIGSHLCKALLAAGNHVVCVDNFYTGTRDNVAELLEQPGFTLIKHDINKPLCYQAKVQEIYNLACPASPVHYQSDPIGTVKTNVIGMMNILELACRHGAKVLQASTSEVYGDPLVHPQQEDYWGHVNPLGLRSCYDEGKRCAESLCFSYHRQYGTKVKVVRIFNTYGPQMRPDDGRVISNFILQALQNRDITIYGTGLQTRSFCYIDDLIAGLLLMMASGDECSGPINLGNPDEFSIQEIARRVLQLTASSSKLVFQPLPPDDPKQRQPQIEMAKAKLGWQPSIPLEIGLTKTIAYFREKGAMLQQK